MKTRITILLSFITTLSIAQVTVMGRYAFNNSETLDLVHDSENVLTNAIDISVGYWFRLKNKRLEFIPEVGYTKLSGDEVSVGGYNADLNILIYPLDFNNDCNSCPTFSKEGGTIKKGFHWIIAPGFTSYEGTELFESTGNFGSFKFSTPRIGLGAGIDFGITNMLALTPIAMLNFGKKYEISGSDQGSRYRQGQLGLRATLRFDKNKW